VVAPGQFSRTTSSARLHGGFSNLLSVRLHTRPRRTCAVPDQQERTGGSITLASAMPGQPRWAARRIIAVLEEARAGSTANSSEWPTRSKSSRSHPARQVGAPSSKTVVRVSASPGRDPHTSCQGGDGFSLDPGRVTRCTKRLFCQTSIAEWSANKTRANVTAASSLENHWCCSPVSRSSAAYNPNRYPGI
jgi:hypothetical protein